MNFAIQVFSIVVICVAFAAQAKQSFGPPELPTSWEIPPGDPLEHMTAGYAKILCSALFITGRKLADAAEEDGFFVSPPAERKAVKKTVVDERAKAVHLTLGNGVTRSARLFGDQGCVILPPGRRDVFFKPVRTTSSLPDPASHDWPMGDRLPDGPLPKELDTAKIEKAAGAAFEPGESLTAAYVVAYKGRIVAERYGPGITRDTPLPSWSMGKSIAATLMGQLIHQREYDLWEPAPVEEWRGPGDQRAQIRIGDLMRMSSGLRFVAPQDPDYNPARGYPDHLYIYTGAIDAIRWAITRPLQWLPNQVGRYRNSDPLAITHLIQQAAVKRKVNHLQFPQKLLFDRIGIRNMVLETDPYGNLMLPGYDLGTGRDWLRLGLLYLQDGVWNGERLLPYGWSDFVRTPAPAWARPVYGAFFWLNRTGRWPVPEDAYFMAGAGGQYAIIIPTHDLVVVRLGHYKGQAVGEQALKRSLSLLMEAVPQVRPAWQVPTKDN